MTMYEIKEQKLDMLMDNLDKVIKNTMKEIEKEEKDIRVNSFKCNFRNFSYQLGWRNDDYYLVAALIRHPFIEVDFIITFVSFFTVYTVIAYLSASNFSSSSDAIWHMVACDAIFSVLTVLTWSMAGKHRFMWQGTSNRELLRFIYSDFYLFIVLFAVSKLFRGKVDFFIPGGFPT